ncbi:MAG: heme-binding protein [Isosphaeraceae bacterium]
MRLPLGLAALGLSVCGLFGIIPPSLAAGDEPPPSGKAEKPLRAADSDSPLPEGWPDATKPDVIEVKHYPAYRSAVARAKGASMPADNMLFWPLFNHISRKGIEMTAPVVSTYDGAVAEKPKATGEVSMEFLYRSTRQGETGKGVGAVKVEDHPASDFVCFGVQGGMSPDQMRDGVMRLRKWLDEHRSEWVEAGPPRRLGYHGPMTPTSERRWEVQIPIKPAAERKRRRLPRTENLPPFP